MKRFVNATFVLLILLVLGLMASCHKDPTPQPQPQPTPTDSIPTTPTDTIPTAPVKPYDTIYWDIDANTSWAPPHDTIENRLKPGLKKLTMYIFSEDGIDRPVYCINRSPQALNKARKKLQSDIEMDSTLINLYGTLDVNQIGAPGYEPTNTETGTIAWDDAQYLMRYGMNIVPRYSKQH